MILNEMLDLGRGITGLALDLDQSEVGVVVLGTIPNLRKATRCVPLASSCRYEWAGFS